MLAIRMSATGGPEVLTPTDTPLSAPGPGEIQIKHGACGLNYIDIYQRSGLYPMPLPATLGLEGAGAVTAIGEGVNRFKVGDRAAYCSSLGGYAEYNVVKADRAVQIPDTITDEIAAAVLLKGLTAEFLARRIWPLEAGDTVLVHAAAGGVGLILCQWLNRLGIRVIGAVGAVEKMTLARQYGCADVINYREEDVGARVRSMTGGLGVPVVYDSVGAATFDASLASLKRRGLLVSFGNASGPVPAIAPLRLSQGGSLFLTRPTLFDYIPDTASLDSAAKALFGVISEGAVKVLIAQRFALSDAAKAHIALSARETVGASVLIP
jgi:NADPH2:quinone reductase